MPRVDGARRAERRFQASISDGSVRPHISRWRALIVAPRWATGVASLQPRMPQQQVLGSAESVHVTAPPSMLRDRVAEGLEKLSAQLSQGVGDGDLVADRDPLPGGALVEGHMKGQTAVITPEEIALEEPGQPTTGSRAGERS